MPESKRLTKITNAEIAFKDDKLYVHKFDEVYIHPTSKWVKTMSIVQGEKTERWYPLERIREIRKGNEVKAGPQFGRMTQKRKNPTMFDLLDGEKQK